MKGGTVGQLWLRNWDQWTSGALCMTGHDNSFGTTNSHIFPHSAVYNQSFFACYVSSILDISWNGKGDIIMAGGNGGSGQFGKVFRWDSTNALGELYLRGVIHPVLS